MMNVTKTHKTVLGGVNITNIMDQNVRTSAHVVTSVTKWENAMTVLSRFLRVLMDRQLLQVGY